MPSSMADERTVRLAARRRILVGHVGPRVALDVFCPRELRSTHVDVCRRCPRAVAVEDGSVTCIPEVEPRRGQILVGAALGEVSISVEGTTTIVELVTPLEATSWVAVAVLDADHRTLGLLHREQLVGVDPRTQAISLARPLAPVRESSPVMTVVQRMVRERARVLPVVDDASYAVGVLTDLDVLRWAARHKP